MPWADDIQVVYEHYHRYAMAARFAKDRRVLDLACGEGYGAALLAREAAEVVGVDNDPATIEHATQRYAGNHLSFQLGSMTDPDLLADEKRFDLIVCFEAIEHVADHDAVLQLIRARLAPRGLVFMSTPDTAVYQHEHGQDNPFHVKELDKQEFEDLLEGAFRHVAVLRQNVAVGSLLTPADPGDLDTAVDGVRLQTVRQLDSGEWQLSQGVPHTYLIGVAAHRPLPTLPAAAVLLDADAQLARGHVSDDVLRQRDDAVADVSRVNELYQDLRAETEELKGTVAKLETLRSEQEQRAEAVELQREQLATEVRQLEDQRQRQQARVDWLSETVTALKNRVLAADEKARELQEHNTQLAEQVEQNSAIAQRAIARYRQLIERAAPRGTLRRNLYETALGRKPGEVVTQPVVPDAGPVTVPHSETPLVSVVIPVHGNWEYTRRCLLSLAEHPVSVPFEVIVVDDVSPDDSAERLAACSGVQLVRAEQNLGYLAATNLGAKQAGGDYVLLLNNDTELGDSALDTLVSTMESDGSIGLVGAALLHSDGSLQECGSIVWNDGTGWNLGRDGIPGAAEHAARREVDYCSGAAVLVRATAWRAVGGYDTRFAPAYYEDTDLAFSLRAAGFRVVVQPAATVTHHEGISHGRDATQGIKRHQEINRATFVDKWRETLAAEHQPPPADTETSRALWVARQRGTGGHYGPIVLVKDHYVPQPDFDSGSVRMWRILEQLVALGTRVVFFPANHATPEPYTTRLRQLGVTVLDRPELQQAFLAEAGEHITLALLSRPQIAWSLVEQLREQAPQCTICYDTVDLHFLRLQRQADLAATLEKPQRAAALARKAQASRELELGLVRCCDVTLVVSDVEAALLAELEPQATVRVLSNVHDVLAADTQPTSELDGRQDLLFVGGFDHPPNVDAAEWAAQEILPIVRQSCPQAVLHVVGSNPTQRVQDLAGPGVVVHGWVDDLAPHYARARVSLAPLRFGAGVKGKVGEALAAGVPVVATPLAVEGMRLESDTHVLLAEDAGGLAEAAVRLLSDDQAWWELREAGREAVAAQFSPEVCRERLTELLAVASLGSN